MGNILAWPYLGTVINASYFVTAYLFIMGLKRMSSPKTARGGILWAGAGMLVATLFSFVNPAMGQHVPAVNYVLMIIAMAVGGGLAWYSGRRVAMTSMPQMIALYNGMGGGAAACIAAVELFGAEHHQRSVLALAVLGAIIGAVSFSGSLIAFGKLQGLIRKSLRSKVLQIVNLLIFIAVVAMAISVVVAGNSDNMPLLTAFFLAALVVGILTTLPIGGADMPVVISLYNALTGLAVAFEGFVLQNAAMIIAGTVVGAAGGMLTQLMAKSMNRPLTNVLFAGFGADEGAQAVGGEGGALKPIDVTDAAVMMAFANKVIIVPGYGMAVAQAQHKVWELVQMLMDRDVTVKFAIHPVAGRMPGHMNVLLAEAEVPYEKLMDRHETNNELDRADCVIVLGANDVVNPVARKDVASPIKGMPILDVDKAGTVMVIKRSLNPGFAGVDNELFYMDNTAMVFGDGKKTIQAITEAMKAS